MAILDRDAILSAKDIETDDVPCPEWGDADSFVRCATLGATAYTTIANENTDDANVPIPERLNTFHERICAVGIVGEDGVPLFTEADVEALGKKSNKPIIRCFNVIMRLSGVERGQQKETEGNSEGETTGASSSD